MAKNCKKQRREKQNTYFNAHAIKKNWLVMLMFIGFAVFLPLILGAYGDYIKSFDTAGDGASAAYGVASNGSHIFVLESSGGGSVYYFLHDGTYDSKNWGLNSSNSVGRGITYNETYFFITQATGQEVYIYNRDGTDVRKFSLDDAGTYMGITTNDSRIWLTNIDDNTIYQYDHSGNKISSFIAHMNSPTGIVMNDSNLFVVDQDGNNITKFDFSGNLISNISMNDALSDLAYGMSTNGTVFWVQDFTDSEVYIYEANFFAEAFSISLDAPTDNGYSISNPQDFTITLNPDGGFDLKNVTISVYNHLGLLLNQTTKTVTGTGTNTTNVSIYHLPAGHLKWNAEGCQDDGSTTDCLSGTINLTLKRGIYRNNETFTASVLSTDTQNFQINLDYNDTKHTNIIGYLVYNKTAYGTTKIGTGTNTIFSRNLTIPPVIGATDLNFYWNFTLTNTSGTNFYVNTTAQSQTINRIIFQLCNSTYSDVYINFSFKEEILGTILNGTFEATFDYWLTNSSGDSALNYSYSSAVENVSYSFCASPNYTSLQVDMSAQFGATGFEDRTYYLNNATLTNSTNNLTLYLLNTSSATKFYIEVKNGIDPFAGATIQISKYFTGEGVYKTMGIRQTDDEGEFIEYLELDENYRFIILRGGISYGVIDKSASCSAAPCELTLQVEGVLTNIWEAFTNTYATNIFSNITFNSSSEIVTYTFIDITGLANYFRLIVSQTSFNNTLGVTICDVYAYATSGSLTCNLTGYAGDFIAKGYISRSPEILDKTFNIIISEAYEELGLLNILLNIAIIVTMVLSIAVVTKGSPSAVIFILGLTILLLKLGGLFPFSWYVVTPLELILMWLLMKSKG